MYILGNYVATDNMSDLITENHHVLLVMSRFGISLGFGEKTIEEVCNENGVDVKTFLVVVNMLLDDNDTQNYADTGFSIDSLISYLHNSHDYFLNFRLPAIRTKLEEVLGGERNNLTQAILNYFDEYVAEVQNHMMYEENTVFPYVHDLLKGKKQADYTIDIFLKQHDQVESRLKEFKNIMIKYYPSKSTNEINNILFDIFNCEHDLASHNSIEDRLFVPAIMSLEQNLKVKA
jgi:regulator of cell morphogenesis and NO signaling